ncbi:MAG TPA: hypothetical protein P5293_01035 [Bacteroidales bacterium]|nr:hypothetical protein [Bacteroidales bacterium]
MIDIFCTAIRRPIIVEETFKSFKENLFKNHKCRLIINVDPVGENISSYEIVEIGKKYFDEIYPNTPTEASFSRAFKWVMSQGKNEYVFNLEDDWLLLRECDLSDMINILERNKNLACIRLPNADFSCKWPANIPKIFLEDGKISLDHRFCGHPALWKMDFFRDALKIYDENINPERQFRFDYEENKLEMKNLFKKWQLGVFYDKLYIKDIGRRYGGRKNRAPKIYEYTEKYKYLVKWEI